MFLFLDANRKFSMDYRVIIFEKSCFNLKKPNFCKILASLHPEKTNYTNSDGQGWNAKQGVILDRLTSASPSHTALVSWEPSTFWQILETHGKLKMLEGTEFNDRNKINLKLLKIRIKDETPFYTLMNLRISLAASKRQISHWKYHIDSSQLRCSTKGITNHQRKTKHL